MSALSQFRLATRLSSWLCCSATVTRLYGSTAAAQLDYDRYNCYDDDAPPRISGEMAEFDAWETVRRGVQWVIIGDPTVKQRSVYADRLAKLLDVPHISMSSLVRQELSPNTSLYKKIASAVNQGRLVPEDVIFGLLSKRLEEGNCRGEVGFILDGVPRTRIQAEILDQIADIDLVLNLKRTEESAMKETSGNGIYSPSQGVRSISNSGFGLNTQTQVSRFQSLPDKLDMCAEQRKMVEEYYNRQKKLLNFQVTGRPADTWEGLLATLQLQHLRDVAVTSTANSSLKLRV